MVARSVETTSVPTTSPRRYGGHVRPAQKVGETAGAGDPGEAVSSVAGDAEAAMDGDSDGRGAADGRIGAEYEASTSARPANQCPDLVKPGATESLSGGA
jgi:hypothetical protein